MPLFFIRMMAYMQRSKDVSAEAPDPCSSP